MKRPAEILSHVLDEAKKIVYGRAQANYGHPRENCAAIAAMWDAYLIRRGVIPESSEGLVPRDVANMMVLMKVARDAEVFKHDNSVDIAGYAEVGERVNEVSAEGGEAYAEREARAARVAR